MIGVNVRFIYSPLSINNYYPSSDGGNNTVDASTTASPANNATMLSSTISFTDNPTTSSVWSGISTTSSSSGNSTQCLNGGVQIGVFCYCFAPYYGDRCQCKFQTNLSPLLHTIFFGTDGGNNTVSTTGSWFSASTTGSGNSASVTTISPTIGASTTAPPSLSTTPPVSNSTQCSNGGVLIGQYCYCRDPYYGDHCQCKQLYLKNFAWRRTFSVGGSKATQVRFKRAIAQVFHEILEDVEGKDVSLSTTASVPVSQTTVQPTFPMTTVTASKNSTNFHPTYTTPASPTVTTASGTSTSTQCLNGGIQIGDVCYCRAPYFGSQCQCQLLFFCRVHLRQNRSAHFRQRKCVGSQSSQRQKPPPSRYDGRSNRRSV